MFPQGILLPAQKGTTTAEIIVLSAENPERSKVLSFDPEVGQNITLYAPSASRNCCTSLISAFLVHSTVLLAGLRFPNTTGLRLKKPYRFNSGVKQPHVCCKPFAHFWFRLYLVNDTSGCSFYMCNIIC